MQVQSFCPTTVADMPPFVSQKFEPRHPRSRVSPTTRHYTTQCYIVQGGRRVHKNISLGAHSGGENRSRSGEASHEKLGVPQLLLLRGVHRLLHLLLCDGCGPKHDGLPGLLLHRRL